MIPGQRLLEELERVAEAGNDDTFELRREFGSALAVYLAASVARDSLPQLDAPISQEQFGIIVGVSQPVVSAMIASGTLQHGQTLGEWLSSYCRRLRDQAAGRDADGSLAKERAALSRSQRLGQDIRNAKEMGEWAPIGLLGDVLALAAAAVTDRFDALEGDIRKACPDLPGEARDAVSKIIVSARAEWIRSTAELVDRALDGVTEEDPSDEPQAEADDEAA